MVPMIETAEGSKLSMQWCQDPITGSMTGVRCRVIGWMRRNDGGELQGP